MFRGLYSGAAAMEALARQQEVISTNLANMQTGGYRRAVLGFSERMDSADATSRAQTDPGPKVSKETVDFSQGVMQQSGRKLDVAINGDGFFVVQSPEGPLYTRNGSFHRTAEGALVTAEGLPVLGNGGPVIIDPSVSEQLLEFDAQGNISANGQQLGQLQLVSFEDNSQLIPKGQVFFAAAEGMASTPATGQLFQGVRELSNAHPVTELVGLIVNSRLFEAAQRSMRALTEAAQQNYRA